MISESIAFRVEYSSGAVYHLLASTDCDNCDEFDDYFRGIEYTPRNGVASVISYSDDAKTLDKYDKNLFMPHGTARRAAELMIERLNKLNEAEPLFVTDY
jgi:hypothetical protein